MRRGHVCAGTRPPSICVACSPAALTGLFADIARIRTGGQTILFGGDLGRFDLNVEQIEGLAVARDIQGLPIQDPDAAAAGDGQALAELVRAGGRVASTLGFGPDAVAGPLTC